MTVVRHVVVTASPRSAVEGADCRRGRSQPRANSVSARGPTPATASAEIAGLNHLVVLPVAVMDNLGLPVAQTPLWEPGLCHRKRRAVHNCHRNGRGSLPKKAQSFRLRPRERILTGHPGVSLVHPGDTKR